MSEIVNAAEQVLEDKANAPAPRFVYAQLRMLMNVPESEFSMTFVQAMYDRMAVSYAGYGPVAKAFPTKVDAIATAQDKIKQYQETGNQEWLVDAANYLLIEFLCPRHEQAHFRATDNSESRGRVWNDGLLKKQANVTPVTAALRQSREGD